MRPPELQPRIPGPTGPDGPSRAPWGTPAWPPRPARRPGPPLAVHVALLLATFGTLALTGGLFWEGAAEGMSDLDLLVALATSPRFVRDVTIAGLPYALWVLAILGAHEMGHYVACRRYRIPATLPFFLPGIPFLGSFGAVIRIRGAIPHRRALFDVAAAGPIAGFAVTLPALVVGLATAAPARWPTDLAELEGGVLFGESLLMAALRSALVEQTPIEMNSTLAAGWVGLLVTSLNLFGVGQLDGGHAAYAVSRRLHRLLSYGTLAGLLALVVAQAVVLREMPVYLLWLAVLLWMRDRHPRLLDETAPLGSGRKALAWVLLLIFAASFMPLPVKLVGG